MIREFVREKPEVEGTVSSSDACRVLDFW